MKGKICIITGANAGIGLQAAIQIAGKGYHVILACRNETRGKDALDKIRKTVPSASLELGIVDMGLRESIIRFAKKITSHYDHLDVLIQNAAQFNIHQKKGETTSEGVETFWATNHLGPVLLTLLLRQQLEKSDDGRVLTISSKGLVAKPFLQVDLNDVEFKSRRFNVVNAYYQSKLAQMMYTNWLAEKLENTNVTANCIRVTAVKVDLSRYPDLSSFMKWVYSIKARKALSPEIMAETYTDLASSPEYRNITGKYFDEKSREINSPRYCRKRENIRAVMELTKKYIPELGDV